MNIKALAATWKYPAFLLFGIGVVNIGAWVYFIALNLIVLDLTHSALAVSALYMLRPLATLFTNVWAGSMIDRMNKRNVMTALDLLRAVLISVLPLCSSLWYIYSFVFIINMAGSVFGPASGTYITKLIPEEQRQRFNALNSLMGSGAFMIGPAIAGMLFMIGSPSLAIYMNAAALFLSGLITIGMPNIEKGAFLASSQTRITWEMLKQDWIVVIQFYRRYVFVGVICLLFSIVMIVMASAVDSLEAAFAKAVLQLSERDYGILVSISGAGVIVGASINTLIVKKVRILTMIGVGTLGVCSGYLVYAFSTTFAVAAASFFALGFFLAFVNTGFYTFYQNHVPVEIMGRVGSMNGLLEAILIMAATAAAGAAAEIVSIQAVVIVGVLIMSLFGMLLSASVMRSSKNGYFKS